MLIVLVAAGRTMPTNQQAQLDAKIDQDLRGLEASGWQDRAASFYALLEVVVDGGFYGRVDLLEEGFRKLAAKAPDTVAAAHTALIDLLVRENRTMRQGRHSEQEMDYWGDLIGAVMALHDKRAVNVLVADLDTGGMAQQGVAYLGKDGLAAIIPLCESKDLVQRDVAVLTLARMTATDGLTWDSTSLAAIRDQLLRAAHDPEFQVRIAAIGGLKNLPGDDVTRMLQWLTDSDPFGRKEQGRGLVYPVRDAARAALAVRPKVKKQIPRSVMLRREVVATFVPTWQHSGDHL
jgi:hypothetical protein